MLTCNKIQKRLNELRKNGKKVLILKKTEATQQELEEISECGYTVKYEKTRIIISE